MSSTILTNWTVYYADDAGAGAGMKQIQWTGTTGTNTVNQLYSALADLFSVPAQNNADDTIPMRAVTPTLYQIGAFDAGDLEPWFIDPESIKHLTGGGLNTVNWTRDLPGDGTGAIGIIMVQCSSGSFGMDLDDVGDSCTHDSDNDSGVILHVDTTNYQVWIRPDDNTLANDFNTGSGTISADTSSNAVTQTAVGASGENVWSNIYTIGAIADETLMYVYQDGSQITGWWPEGHIDILILVEQFDTLIDFGLLTIYARKYSTLYENFTTDASNGGRIPNPISTADDLNNDTGYLTITATGTVIGTFNADNYIYAGASWATATKKAVLTYVNGNDLTYYLIGDLTDFSGDALTEWTGTGDDATATSSSNPPVAAGPNTGTAATITVTFSGALSEDLNNDNGSRPYDVTIDCQQVPLDEVYERLKYLTRRGQTSDIDTGTLGLSIIGQAYEAVGEYYLTYTTGSGSLTEGNTVTGGTSGAAGTIVSNHGDTAIVIRSVSGTFEAGESISEGANTGTNITVGPIEQKNDSPFGTFAGGKFFGARGVWITDYAATDGNNFELIDSTGTQQVPPVTVPITITNTVSGDRVSVFETMGLDSEVINKFQFNIDATQPAAPAGEIRVEEVIPNDTPAAGWIRVVQRTASGKYKREQRIDYTSWNNTGQPAYSTFDLSGNTYGNTKKSYADTDTAYVPYIDEEATGTSVSDTFVYTADRNVLIRVRIKGILPFKQVEILDNDGFSVRTIRTTDSIYQ